MRKRIKPTDVYTSMDDKELQELPEFKQDGSIKFYLIGKEVMGKRALIQYIKSIKQHKHGL